MATPNLFRLSVRIALLTAFVLGPIACTSGDDGSSRDESNDQDIVAGKTASTYPEAVLVDLYRDGQEQALCSGSLIAPKVVLTAGHCVHDWDAWTVEAPFAKGQTASAKSGATYDWTAETETVDPSMHDIGLVFLSTAITLTSYPTIATEHVPFGSKVENIGRIRDGEPSFSQLFVGKSVTAADGSSYGFPFSYSSTEIIESGDSGGPVVKTSTHEIVAVNSGAGNGLQILARTDLVASWIAKEIAAHGGGGAKSSASSSSSSGSDTTDCGSLSFAGECSGNTVKWCENGTPQEMSCTASKKTCKYDKANKYYNCM